MVTVGGRHLPVGNTDVVVVFQAVLGIVAVVLEVFAQLLARLDIYTQARVVVVFEEVHKEGCRAHLLVSAGNSVHARKAEGLIGRVHLVRFLVIAGVGVDVFLYVQDLVLDGGYLSGYVADV
ncbi:hypothetical protein Barb6_02278 [Bacteroidales bacterium Barb6]|nr:hypothetical protein Barb6_02278 [Bacteroidales bacterium Barb6]